MPPVRTDGLWLNSHREGRAVTEIEHSTVFGLSLTFLNGMNDMFYFIILTCTMRLWVPKTFAQYCMYSLLLKCICKKSATS